MFGPIGSLAEKFAQTMDAILYFKSKMTSKHEKVKKLNFFTQNQYDFMFHLCSFVGYFKGYETIQFDVVEGPN